MDFYHASIDIALPPEAVFDYLADFTRHGEWSGDKLRVEPLSDGPVGAGSKFRTFGMQYRPQEDAVTVTEFERPRRIAFDAAGTEGVFRNIIEIEPAPGGSRVTKRFAVVSMRPLTRIVWPFFPLLVPRTMKLDLKRIKRRLEAS